jgi:hypothetical protein
MTNKLIIQADKSSSLKIDHNNETLVGIVDYASQGGGNISLKVSGLKKRLQTSNSVKEIEISDIELQGQPAQVAATIKELLG